ncbi:ribosomal protein L1 [Delitschia confertaspora ATCC 74209]|uniref:Ribosomal protein L1 n=1 Tax=Delitschia confertaspora ATCC 74209 TaxID=1513339 RepID=A0A9P4JHJ3_9PLEO|nr:ribosomal protein L1 [Delitschia confertaspora ATCC 74209]
MAKTEKSETRLTTKVQTGSPYQLEKSQITKATTALLTHIKKRTAEKEQKSGKKNLLADADAEEESELKAVPVWLTVGTKKHIHDQARLKPSKIALPHPIQNPDSKICLITVDPQRAYKNLKADPAFPAHIASKIGRVIGLKKLKTKYKTYETKRQLFAEYDLFLCDERIASALPSVLGKVFYGGNTKRPIPVDLTAGTKKPESTEKPKNKEEKDVRIGTPQAVGREIENALNSTLVNMTSSANTAIKVGNTAMSSQDIVENVEAVVAKVTEKFIPKGWRGVRSLHIKGPNTMALPIWLADELWAEDEDVLEEKWKPAAKNGEPHVSEKKRKWEEWEDELLDDDEKNERRAAKAKGKKPKAIEGGAETKKSVSSRKNRRKLKQSALSSVQTPPIASS